MLSSSVQVRVLCCAASIKSNHFVSLFHFQAYYTTFPKPLIVRTGLTVRDDRLSKMAATKFLSVIIAAAIYCIGSTSALSVQCKGVDIEVTEQHMMDVKDCLTNVKIGSIKDLTPENAGCFSRCVMENKGLVDSSYKPHKENINKMIDDTLPAALVDEWKGEVGKCLDNEGQNLKSATDDPKCSSFLPLSMCVHMAFIKVCKT